MVPDSRFEIVPRSLKDLFFIQIESKLSNEDGDKKLFRNHEYFDEKKILKTFFIHSNCKHESKWQIDQTFEFSARSCRPCKRLQ